MGERPSPDAPHPGKKRPPRAPLWRPHSAQSQLTTARVVGLVTGPHARTPRTHSQWVVGPGRTPERMRGRGWESARPWTPTPRQEAPPPGILMPTPQHARARAVGLVTGPQGRTPRTHSQWVVGPGRTPERMRGRGWESKRPWTPTPRQEAPPPGILMPPPQHARARAVGLVTGPQGRTPRTHSQWVVGPGRTPERMRGRGWESARPRTPHTQARGAPPGHHHAAPTARRSARCGVVDGSPRPHPPDPQPVGSGPRPHARTDGRSGVGERPSPDAPHPGKRRPPPRHPHSAPTARKASSQERALWGW